LVTIGISAQRTFPQLRRDEGLSKSCFSTLGLGTVSQRNACGPQRGNYRDVIISCFSNGELRMLANCFLTKKAEMFLGCFRSGIWGYPRTVPQLRDQECRQTVSQLENRVSQLNVRKLGPRYVPETVPQLDIRDVRWLFVNLRTKDFNGLLILYRTGYVPQWGTFEISANLFLNRGIRNIFRLHVL
jgi:hypothetical protein